MNLTPNEVLIIGFVALVALGPRQMPDAVRRAAAGLTKLKHFSRSLKNDLDEAVNNSVVTSGHDEFLAKSSNERSLEEIDDVKGDDKDLS
ncbi:MAG: twin-arginine translocase TatA/TatE family subunit [Acidimicrobiales bacterium]|nr:twin-arginine translocase TatA/TatE family subunit [Acidimicrobiales bacterium]